MKTSEDSQMPEWKCDPLGGVKVGITCPYKDCDGKAVVNKRKWFRGRKGGATTVNTRACTYCQRAAWLPGLKP